MNPSHHHHHFHSPIPDSLKNTAAVMIVASLITVPLFGYVPLAMTVGGIITVAVMAKRLKLNG